MNRRTMFKAAAAACLSAMPVSRAVAAQDARGVPLTGVVSSSGWATNQWTHGTMEIHVYPGHGPITSDAEWDAQGWASEPIALDFSDQHGAISFADEDHH